MARARYSSFIVIALWFLLTLALAAWWMVFSYRLLGQVAPAASGDFLASKQRMLAYEGATLILLIASGGFALAYYVWREQRRNRQIKEFFASFTHDLKTPIASLRLQAEGLQEDWAGTPQARLTQRLLKDVLRLELHLDNSLFLATIEELGQLHSEEVALSRVVAKVQESWPDAELHLSRDCVLLADERALLCILRNIVNNAVVHGKASRVDVNVEEREGNRIELAVEDNGSGFHGNVQKIGSLFARHTPKSGSGLGLFLVRSLVKKMRGEIRFLVAPAQRLRVNMLLPGRLP